MQVISTAAIVASFSALVLGAIGLGGGIYETLLVDRVWPHNLTLIQPGRGGIDRKLFWGPVHMFYEVALLVAAWLVWNTGHVRGWIVVALVAHFAARAWSFAYFIPRALRFEKLASLTEQQNLEARRWIRLSRCRPVFEFVSVVALCNVITRLTMP